MRPVLCSGISFRYLLKSISSMNSSNAKTGLQMSRNLEINICKLKILFLVRGYFTVPKKSDVG